jgi:hypothetical protein
MGNIITIPGLGLDKEYLLWAPGARKEVCKKIVIKAFQAMKVKADTQEKINVMTEILNRSIKEYERTEEYEFAQILFEIKQAMVEINPPELTRTPRINDLPGAGHHTTTKTKLN